MKKTIIAIVVLWVIWGAIYFVVKMSRSASPQAQIASTTVPDTSGATLAAIAEIPTYQYLETYTSSTYKFIFKYPKDFTIQEIPTDTGETVVVQNIPKKIGVQITLKNI